MKMKLFGIVAVAALVSACAGDDVDGDGVPQPEDCAALDPSVYPGAEELCDGLDNDCDGVVDEDTGADVVYADVDADGYGGEDAVVTCGSPAGYSASSGDCDDTDASVYPGAAEMYDNADNDCDGVSDDGILVLHYSYDIDFDGYGDGVERVGPLNPFMGIPIVLYDVDAPVDCNDQNASVYPGAADISGDGLDADCDGCDGSCSSSNHTPGF